MPLFGGPTENAPSGQDANDNFRADMAVLEEGDDTPLNTPTSILGDDDEIAPLDDNDEQSEAPDSDDENVDDDDVPDVDETPTPEDESKIPEVTRHSRPTIQQIKSKYPEFFKEFPDMRHMLFREGEYSNIFPTVDDAKTAASKADDFERFSELLSSGKQDDFVEFMKGISEAGSETMTGMAANFLPSLYKTNRDMYFQVTTPIAESLVRNAYKQAVQNGNENLKNAALHVAQWAFGDVAFATGDKMSEPLKVKEETKDPAFENEKKQFYEAKYNDTRDFVNNNSLTRLRSDIKRGLDPNGVFNEFTSNLLIKQIVEEVGVQLEADSRHMATMNSLWKQANKAGFAGNWKDRILATYLSRARALMPAVRGRIRAAALKTEEQRSESRTRQAEKSSSRRDVGGKSGGKAQSTPINSKTVDWNKTSDVDFLSDRVTLRGK